MQNGQARLRAAHLPWNRLWISLLVLAAFGAGTVYALLRDKATPLPAGTVTLSQSALEETYGLQINLIAATAAGGFVDVRMRIMDGEKARRLLGDSKNFPALVTENGLRLNAPADARSQKIRFEDNSSLFVMYPNSGGAIRPGTPVTMLFGGTALEPIHAQ